MTSNAGREAGSAVRRKVTADFQQSPHVKVWLEIDGEYSFGHGICEILRAIDRTGSIKVAAEELGKSYRYVWGRVKSAETTLGQGLVETRVGGQGERRSQLTDFARRAVEDFTTLRQRMKELVHREFLDITSKSHRGAD